MVSSPSMDALIAQLAGCPSVDLEERSSSLFASRLLLCTFFRFFSLFLRTYVDCTYVQVQFLLRKSISLPPPPTIFSKCLFFSFQNCKTFTNTKLGAERSKFVKGPLISNSMKYSYIKCIIVINPLVEMD